MTPNPMPVNGPPAPPRKGMSGCLIAVLVVGGLVGLVCLVGGFLVWRAANSADGKKVFAAINQGVKMVDKGMNAPGAAEIRAAGCKEGLVIDMKDALEVAEIFVDGGLKDDKGELDYVMVSCSGPYGSDLPDCDKLARVYAKAVRGERDFTVQVKAQGSTKPKCEARYSGDGKAREPAK